MKKALLLSAFSVFFVSSAFAADWGYFGPGAAHKWGDLSEAYQVCKTGGQQSPINIDAYVQEALPPLALSYNPAPLVVGNNGKSVEVEQLDGTFDAYGKAYKLDHLHFHTPSEHYIDGAPYPMEVHFVHKANDGALAVVGVMLKVGDHNPVIEGIWQNVPQVGESKNVEGVEINVADLLPVDKGYYAYDGSLTTPPCSEGVKWHVMKDPIELSADQLTAFQAVFPVNARPIQALGARKVSGN